MKTIVLSLAFFSLTGIAFAQKTKDFTTMSSLIKEAKEKGHARQADSIAHDYIDKYLFKLKENELMTVANLGLIKEFLKADSKGFKFFIKRSEKINTVLGDYAAQYGIRIAIYNAFMPKGDIAERKKTDWKSLEKRITDKYGEVGLEEVLANAMATYLEAEDWVNFGKYYMLYFAKALKHPVYHVNNLSWPLFEHVEDQNILKFACKMMKYKLENGDKNNIEAYDTYANLLHKAGRTKEAIEWEEKAVSMKNGQPDEKIYTNTLEKMKKGLPTWVLPVKN